MDLGTVPQWLTFITAVLTFVGVVVGFYFTLGQLRHNRYVRETENILNISGTTMAHNTHFLGMRETHKVIQMLEGLNVPPSGAEEYWTARGVHLGHINLACRVWELAGRPGRGEAMNPRFDGWERFAREIIAKKLRGSAQAIKDGGMTPEDFAGSDLWYGLQTYEVYKAHKFANRIGAFSKIIKGKVQFPEASP